MKNNKKGFTLAELLIVVAIIAVLVAIAVPLFVGGLNRAQEGVYDANERALKGAAVVKILSDDTAQIEDMFAGDNKVYASAVVDHTDGSIGAITITWGDETKCAAVAAKVTSNYADWTGSTKGTADEITVEITQTDINKGTIEEGKGK